MPRPAHKMRAPMHWDLIQNKNGSDSRAEVPAAPSPGWTGHGRVETDSPPHISHHLVTDVTRVTPCHVMMAATYVCCFPHHYWCDTRLSPSWSPWSLWPHLVSPAARPWWPPWGCMRWCPPCPWSAWTPCLPYVVITADLVGACCELCWLTGSPLSPSPHSRTLWPGAGTQHPPLAWQAGPHTPAWPLLTVSGERERERGHWAPAIRRGPSRADQG